MRRSNIDISFFVIIALLAYSSLRSGLGSPTDWIADKLMLLPAIVIGLSCHEFAHAFVAYKMGDNTPKLQGRVTLNPLAHIDWVGLAALFFCGFGWGVPVEINPNNFRKPRSAELMVAAAGVIMNLLLAVLFTILLKVLFVTIGTNFFFGSNVGYGILEIFIYIIQINLVLMIFNLIPCPPLDGFNVLAQIMGFGQTETYWRIYQYGNWLLVLLIVTGITGKIISPCISAFMKIAFAFLGLS